MDRRKFVKTTGLGLASMALAPQLLAQTTQNEYLGGNWFWINGSSRVSMDRWKLLFERLSQGGFRGALCNASDTFYEEMAPVLAQYDMKLHAWRWTLNRSNYAKEHPDWYAVNRNHESVLDKPPYVGYYRWLCPSNEGVRKVIAEDYRQIASIPGLGGVHLDYVRYCDSGTRFAAQIWIGSGL